MTAALAATAVVVATDSLGTDDERRAAFEVTARLFAWAQPEQPLAALEALASSPGDARPWALRALGVARGSAEDYADARAIADTLVAHYAESEHARFGHGLAVRAAVGADDEAGAVAALTALASSFPEAEELGGLAALVAGAFPDADLSGIGLRMGGGAGVTSASAYATAGPVALLAVGSVRPNPSTGGASLPLTLSREAAVEAVLYDVLGRRVAVLASGAYAAGRHVLVLAAAPGLASGVYVVHVTARTDAGTEAAVRRLTLTR